MVVVVILSIVATIAFWSQGNNMRGGKAAAFARSLLAVAHETRHAALTMGQRTQISLVTGSPSSVAPSYWNATSASWVPLAGALNLPADLSLCNPVGVMNFGAAAGTVTCTPLTGTNNICFSPDGRVSLQTTATCSTTINPPPTGASIYFSTRSNTKYKLVLFGLTGMPKLIDQW